VSLLRGIREAHRRRVLAGDTRAGSWARGRARTAQRDYLHEHWLVFTVFVVVVLLVAAACSALMPNSFMRGLTIGAALVAAPVTVWFHAVQVTGSAPVMMGDLSEQWTAHALRGLGRRSWQLVNHFALGGNDIDHVVLGPGGAFAIETKWSGSPWHSHFGEQRQRKAIDQARKNARSLRLWHPFKSREIPVEPVVVLWGRKLNAWAAEHRVRVVDDVTVVVGDELRSWLNNHDGGVLSARQVEEGWAALDEHTLRRDALDAVIHPMPPSLGAWAARAGLAIASAVAGLFAFNAVLQGSHSPVLTVAAAAALAAAGMVPVRLRAARWVWPAAWGWTTSLAVLSVALIAAEVIDRLHK
jgi:hypothetical protein